MKLLVRFLLSLSFFLLGGYAHTSLVRINYTQRSIFESAAQARYMAVQSVHAFYSQAPASGTRHVNDVFSDSEVEDDDDDDDESKHNKKSSGSYNGGINFLMQVSADSYHSLTDPLPFCEHFSYTSGLKFIIHCVIRI